MKKQWRVETTLAMRQNVVDSFSLFVLELPFSLLYDAVIYIHIISYLEREFRVKHFQYCTTSIHKRNMKYAVTLAHILKYGTLPRSERVSVALDSSSGSRYEYLLEVHSTVSFILNFSASFESNVEFHRLLFGPNGVEDGRKDSNNKYHLRRVVLSTMKQEKRESENINKNSIHSTHSKNTQLASME